jgi:hypothetical protein
MKKNQIVLLVVLCVLAVGVGVGAGGFLGSRTSGSAGGGMAIIGGGSDEVVAAVPTDVESVRNGDIFGSGEPEHYQDNAQGYLAEGGINGEGSHHLLRPGGRSQTVYLTSASTDLSNFVGMEVRVWGETNRGQHAGWLMDVGRLQVVNVNGEAPTE